MALVQTAVNNIILEVWRPYQGSIQFKWGSQVFTALTIKKILEFLYHHVKLAGAFLTVRETTEVKAGNAQKHFSVMEESSPFSSLSDYQP